VVYQNLLNMFHLAQSPRQTSRGPKQSRLRNDEEFLIQLVSFVAKRPDESSSSEAKEGDKKSSRQPRPSVSRKETKVTGHPATRKPGATGMPITWLYFSI
jgi:hypothetical protein